MDTRKDGVRFTTSELRRLSQEYVNIIHDYDSKQSELKMKTLEVVASYLPVVEEISQRISQLDVLCSFATVAAEAPNPYSKPELSDPATGIRIESGRHPMVEENLDGKSFIANDVELERPDGPGGALAIITGPNMGGKSTYIRMVGVITLMAHCGCWVPATRARISICDRLQARIGAGDNQLKGVSTFMAEMLETSTILRSATRNSLVIIDELGRGTSTYDGYGLAKAIAEHISSRIRCASLFATHFHELTTLATSTVPIGVVRNFHVTAANDPTGRIVFLYEVRSGACDQSFGIHVAEMMGFPSDVVENAKRKAAELEGFTVEEFPVGLSEADRSEGEGLIQQYACEIRGLQGFDPSDTATIQRRRDIRRRIMTDPNPLVRFILSSEA
mmetsp:Transcript_12946/g.26245  ORF Transcript_12946/g.26245 Transcript_12946/m.26245 type:complete len:389 (-) Transcript_12946:610-1776(-)